MANKKLKEILKESNVWDRDFGDSLPTLKDCEERFAKKQGKEVTEDMAQNTQNNNLATSPLDAQQEITDIMDNAEHPYHDGKHREHLQAVEHMRQLHEKVFGK